uniref:UBX domain-containing protein n=1 Tax=Aegilops tauschii TaxID=37682 RepID=M8CU57_AEGTA
MDETPAEARLSGIRQAVLLLERSHPSAPLPTLAGSESKESCRSGVDEQKEVNKIVDRQAWRSGEVLPTCAKRSWVRTSLSALHFAGRFVNVVTFCYEVCGMIRVFFNVRGSSVAEIDTPDSFYKLSGEEVRNEAKMRRERLEQSRLLIPKSYKEKQALAARQKYKQAVIRVQFPDGVILQGVFLPAEATGSLYEFVADALKQPGLEFDLICPAVPRSRVLPHSPNTGERARTLQDEGLSQGYVICILDRLIDSLTGVSKRTFTFTVVYASDSSKMVHLVLGLWLEADSSGFLLRRRSRAGVSILKFDGLSRDLLPRSDSFNGNGFALGKLLWRSVKLLISDEPCRG